MVIVCVQTLLASGISWSPVSDSAASDSVAPHRRCQGRMTSAYRPAAAPANMPAMIDLRYRIVIASGSPPTISWQFRKRLEKLAVTLGTQPPVRGGLRIE